MPKNSETECAHVSYFADEGHVHQMVAVDECEQARLDVTLVAPALLAIGAHVMAVCPGCPGGHFHVEGIDGDGRLTRMNVETGRPERNSSQH